MVTQLYTSADYPDEQKANVDDYNPMTALRHYLKLTQEELAEATGVSEQYLRRGEHGLVSGPSVEIIKEAWAASNSSPIQHAEILLWVRTYIVKLSRLTHRETGITVKYEGPLSATNSHEFEKLVKVWWDFWLLCKRLIISPFPAPKSIYDFAKRLGVHIYVVQHYIKRKAKILDQPLPDVLQAAIGQTQNPDMWLKYLEFFVNLEAKRHGA